MHLWPSCVWNPLGSILFTPRTPGGADAAMRLLFLAPGHNFWWTRTVEVIGGMGGGPFQLLAWQGSCPGLVLVLLEQRTRREPSPRPPHILAWSRAAAVSLRQTSSGLCSSPSATYPSRAARRGLGWVLSFPFLWWEHFAGRQEMEVQMLPAWGVPRNWVSRSLSKCSNH